MMKWIEGVEQRLREAGLEVVGAGQRRVCSLMVRCRHCTAEDFALIQPCPQATAERGTS